MKCFTAVFLQFFFEKRKNGPFRCPAGYPPSNAIVSDMFLKFTNFLRFYVLRRLVTHEATLTFIFW